MPSAAGRQAGGRALHAGCSARHACQLSHAGWSTSISIQFLSQKKAQRGRCCGFPCQQASRPSEHSRLAHLANLVVVCPGSGHVALAWEVKLACTRRGSAAGTGGWVRISAKAAGPVEHAQRSVPQHGTAQPEQRPNAPSARRCATSRVVPTEVEARAQLPGRLPVANEPHLSTEPPPTCLAAQSQGRRCSQQGLHVQRSKVRADMWASSRVRGNAAFRRGWVEAQQAKLG